MKKTKIGKLISVIGASAAVLSLSSSVYAADEPEPIRYNVEVRIEGISDCFYNEKLEIEGSEDFTAASLLTYIDSNVAELSFTGIDEAYVTEINGDKAGTFGGWDGWLYRVNGQELSESISEYHINDGDSIVIFFGDPYGEGMQFPEMDYLEEEKSLVFTSKDVYYDDNWNPVIVENPVSEMYVILEKGKESFIYVTDENGKIDISSLDSESYKVIWSRYNENGLPTVLRSAPDEYFDLGFTLGDFNGDGSIDPVDATDILVMYSVESMNGDYGETELQHLAGDINDDGAIDPSDATIVLRSYSYASMNGTADIRDFIS